MLNCYGTSIFITKKNKYQHRLCVENINYLVAEHPVFKFEIKNAFAFLYYFWSLFYPIIIMKSASEKNAFALQQKVRLCTMINKVVEKS